MDPQTRARLYFAQYQMFDLDLPFWSKLAAETGGPILEMGCGTGRLVQALARQGYHVIGLDRDPAMLERAKMVIDSSLRDFVSWVEADITSFTFALPVRLAIGGLNTFAYLDDGAFVSALTAVKSILDDQGLVVLDLPPAETERISQDEDSVLDTFEDPERGTSIEVRASVQDRGAGEVAVTWKYDELNPDGSVKRYVWEQTYYLRSKLDLQQLIKSAGLSFRVIYGDYDFSHYKVDCDRQLVVIEK